MFTKEYSANSRFLHAEIRVFGHFVCPDLLTMSVDLPGRSSNAVAFSDLSWQRNNLGDAKTGAGIAHWRREICLGQNRLENSTVDLGLKDMSIDEAVAAGAKTMVIGVAPDGGKLCRTWVPTILEALDKGLDVAAGLHDRLVDVPDVSRMAGKEVAHSTMCASPITFPVGTGVKRPGMRLLTVGTDCAVGKMYTSLALEREMRRRGMKADFRPTGQTGIFIAGQGVSVDAVVSDFVSGASESLSPANDPDHWDMIEGQGSLFHPSYAAVTLGLVHGSQPDAMVLCHEAGRSHIQNIEGYPIPDLDSCMELYTTVARLTNAAASFIGACINTASLAEEPAVRFLQESEEALGMPCCDPVRHGVGRIVDAVQSVDGDDAAAGELEAEAALQHVTILHFTEHCADCWAARRRIHRPRRMRASCIRSCDSAGRAAQIERIRP